MSLWHIRGPQQHLCSVQHQLRLLFGSPNHLHVLRRWPNPFQRWLLRRVPSWIICPVRRCLLELQFVVLHVCQFFPHLHVLHVWIFPVQCSVLGQLPRWNHTGGCDLPGLPVPLWFLLGNIQHVHDLRWGLRALHKHVRAVLSRWHIRERIDLPAVFLAVRQLCRYCDHVHELCLRGRALRVDLHITMPAEYVHLGWLLLSLLEPLCDVLLHLHQLHLVLVRVLLL